LESNSKPRHYPPDNQHFNACVHFNFFTTYSTIVSSFCFKDILLMGAGQLRSCYLQGLAGVSQELSITFLNPSSSSLELACQHFIG